MIPRWFTFSACIALLLSFFAGGLLGYDAATRQALWADTPSAARWVPCIGTPSNAILPIALHEWDAHMAASGQEVGEIPGIVRIPEGRYAGEWIFPGCVAVENAYGEVHMWEDTRSSQTRWIPFTQPQQP